MRLLLAVAILLLGSCIASNLNSVEISALYDLYNSTDGPNWDWLNVTVAGPIWDFSVPDPNPCDPAWQGISCSCDDVSCTVVYLLLEDFRMTGTIPESIGNLTYMKYFTFAINYLTGTIPNSITKMTSLVFLDLSDNRDLGGSLPAEIGSMTTLRSLYLSFNSFTGTLPLSLYDASSLAFLELGSNHFEGSLSESVGNLQSLLYFEFSFNHVTGALPSSIGNLSHLEAFLFNDNFINGTIPISLCNLHNLVALYAVDNSFSGTLPDCIGEMISLELMSFNANNLNGTIPASIVLLNRTLTELTMSFNALTGSLPSNLFNVSGAVLDTVYFSHNSLTGPLPEIDLPQLLNIDLSYNYISGSLSNSVLNSTEIVYVDISYNLIEGTIPAGFNQNYYLFQLVMGHNILSGSLPESVLGHSHMAQYMLDFNVFTGTVPYSLCYNDPGYIDLESNYLEGTIPDCSQAVGYTAGHLVYFSMSDNYFSGSIPSYVVAEPNIITFSINNNALTGTLPFLNSTKVLEYFYVQNNKLSGPIQLSAEYQQLQFVDISNNQFSGSLPKDFFNSMMIVKSFAATSNCITGSIPEELCSVTNLTFVDLDGLSTAEECRSLIFPHVHSLTSFVLPNHIQGGIPDCLFSMPLLQTLHISGNSIDWSFPSSDSLVLGEMLSELSLSHNKLTGSIPTVIQTWQWSTLDLSFNRLGGTLDKFVEQNQWPNASLVLQVNRLSGAVPSSLLDQGSINILTGNLFYCDFDRSGLPTNDQAHDTYQCGSNSFNQASIAWLVFAVVTAMLLTAVVTIRWSKSWLSKWSSTVWAKVSLCLAQFTEVECELTTFKNSLEFLRNAMLCLTLAVCGVFLPVYAALTHYYRTVQYQYAWTVSAAFLAGVPPAVVLLVFYTQLVVFLFSLWFYHTRHTKHERQLSASSGSQNSVDKSTKDVTVPLAHRVILVCVVLINCVVMVLVNTGYVLVILNDDSQAVFFAQVAVALFKLLWNDFAVRGMISVGKLLCDKIAVTCGRGEGGASSGGDSEELSLHYSVDMPYLTFIVLFNSIIAPCLATAAVDSNCFYNIIVAPTAVSLQFPYFNVIGTCNFVVAEYTGQTVCGSVLQESYVDVTYDPPFIYSYQCTSSILTNYAAVYVFMFIIVAFFKPLALYLIHRTYTSIPVGSCLHQCIDVTLYELLKPANTKDLHQLQGDDSQNSNRSSSSKKRRNEHRKVLFFKDRFVLRMVGKIAVFVTFGVIFPPLAVIVCAAFISEIYVNFLLIGRFLVSVEEEGVRNQFREVLCRDCEGCMRLLLNPLVTLVVPFATLFYGFFVFDIYGDKAGFAEAFWAPIFLALVPGVLWVGYSTYRVIRDRQGPRMDSLDGFKTSELVVVNALQKDGSNQL